ncbi:penicillin-binding protein, partial [Streptosporangium sp. NPDC048865]
ADVLSGVFTKGTMRAVGGIGRDAAGKTGTTDDYAAAWFAGFTPDLAGAVSIGDPRGSQDHKLTGVTIGGRHYGAVAGASIPGPIWKDTMLAALRNVEPTSFTPIDTERFGGCGQGCRPAPPPPDGDDSREAGPEDEAGPGPGPEDMDVNEDGGGGPFG